MSKEQFWTKYFKYYDSLNTVIPYIDLLNELYERTNIEKGDLVLDAGCGTGNFSKLAKNKGARVIGLDFNYYGLKVAQAKTNESLFFLGDLTRNINFRDGVFDKIICNNVIYTLPAQGRIIALREFNRVLKPDGFVAITALHKKFNPYKIYIDNFKRKLKNLGLRNTIIYSLKYVPDAIMLFYYNEKIKNEDIVKNYHFFEEEELRNLLNTCGFVSIKTYLTYSNQGILGIARKPT